MAVYFSYVILCPLGSLYAAFEAGTVDTRQEKDGGQYFGPCPHDLRHHLAAFPQSLTTDGVEHELQRTCSRSGTDFRRVFVGFKSKDALGWPKSGSCRLHSQKRVLIIYQFWPQAINYI